MDENRQATGVAASEIETVPRKGARRRAILSRAAAAAFLAAGFAIILLIPEMSPVWRLALMVLVVVFASAALILDGMSSPAYRRDHLGFSIVESSQVGGRTRGREAALETRWHVTESVKNHLSQNRISFQERKPFAMGSGDKPENGVFYLENWTAEMNVRFAEADGSSIIHIAVGPVSADNESALRKMLVDLWTELEREVGERVN